MTQYPDSADPAQTAAESFGATDDPASLRFIGTATTLLRLGPFTLLTDPNFLHRGQFAYLGKGLFSRRLTQPAMDPRELPALDAVILSHMHGDHFDRVARRELSKEPPVFTTRPAGRNLRRSGFDARGMTTWQSHLLEREGVGLRITSVPGQHARGIARPLLPTVMGTVLELDTGQGTPRRIYLTGDTLHRPRLAEITQRCGPIDAMVIHLGGTRILGMTVTMDDDQGARLVQAIRPSVTVPVHFDDYRVFKSPREDFVARFTRDALPGDLRVVDQGDTVSLIP